MRVTVLGSGTAVPNPERFPAGYLVSEGDFHALVDIGAGVLRRYAATGLDLQELDAVLLTHYHTDHCADLAILLFALRNPRYKNRPPLRIMGHPGLRELMDGLRQAWPWVSAHGYELHIEEVEPGSFQLGPLQVAAVSIEHTAESLGYRIHSDSGHSVAFSGDAVYCEGLRELARDVDLFICDSAFPDEEPGIGHMTPGEAGRAAQEAGAKTLCLTHFYPECDGHDLVAQAEAAFSGKVLMAEDLMVFELS
ncbi:MAG: MBL fold metallo-hydrolase [Planctomycetota bacterium]|jgi:ribonuclease BN (tRNA processing enzyme)